MNNKKNIEETILWSIIGNIILIGFMGLVLIFLILVHLNISDFFNYTTSGICIGIIISLFLLLLIYNLVNRITEKFGVDKNGI